MAGGIRPGRGQVRVLHLEPKRAGAMAGSAFMVLLTAGIVAAALAYRSGRWPSQWPRPADLPAQAPGIAAGVAALLLVVALISTMVNGRRWHVARVVERLSNDPRLVSLLPDTASTPPLRRAASVPPLDVVVHRGRKLPKPGVRLRPVAEDRNVIGERPLRMAYLRLFENQARIRTFMEGAWREFGSVYLLRSATSVTPAEYRMARRSGDLASLFIASREELLPALDGGVIQARGRCRLASIGPATIRTRDRYGSYPVHALLCHGAFWKAAVDELLDRMDLVVLDLSGFVLDNLGTHYELQRVIDRFPIERVVFLADENSNKKFLTAQLQDAWAQMAAGSPNDTTDPRTAMVVVTDSFVRERRTQVHSVAGPPGQAPMQRTETAEVRVRLVARRDETRRAAALAQARLNEHIAVGAA